MLWLSDFLHHLQSEKRYSQHTRTAYINDIEQFFLFLKTQYDVADEAQVNVTFIKSWIYERTQAGLSANSLHRKLSALSSYYKFLVRKELINSNPFSHIKAPKRKKRLPVWLTEDQMLRLLDQELNEKDFTAVRDQTIMELMYGCGLRLSELISLRHKDIDLAMRTLKVMGKGRKERIIPMPTELINAIKKYKKCCQDLEIAVGDVFLTTEKGKPLYPMLVYRIAKQGLSRVSALTGLSPHKLRHSYATHLLNKGAELNAIKELLGHSSLAATQVYTHNSIERLINIYKDAHPKGKKS